MPPLMPKLEKTSRAHWKNWSHHALIAVFMACTAAQVMGASSTNPTNWANDAELEGIVDLLDPDYQKLPINVSRLPVRHAVKTVYGKGSRTIYTFEDPNCGYCRELHRTLGEIGDLTVYTFVVSFLGDDSVRKANAVWCAKDRAKSWDRVMKKQAIPDAKAPCEGPNAEIKKMIGLLGINLTPTVFFSDGRRMNGVKPRAEIEQALAASKPAKS